MSLNFINQCTEVLKNQINHTKKETNKTGDFFSQMKFKFATVKPNKYISYTEPITYLKRFKSFLYYEWSKRKQEKENINMLVSCVVVSHVYIYHYDNVFLFDEHTEDIIKKIDELDEILSLFFFPDVEVFFCIEEPKEGTEEGKNRPHILEYLLKKKEDQFILNYGFCSINKVLKDINEERKICNV